MRFSGHALWLATAAATVASGTFAFTGSQKPASVSTVLFGSSNPFANLNPFKKGNYDDPLNAVDPRCTRKVYDPPYTRIMLGAGNRSNNLLASDGVR